MQAVRGPKRRRGRGAAAPPTRIVIAAGGTAGHVVPALAVADALRAEGAEVVFVGGERAEARARPRRRLRAAADPGRGHSPHEPAEGRARGRPRGAGAAHARTACCARQRPDAVLGGGGYVAGPVGLAAVRAADPARADRGRQPPRPHQPPARAARRGASASRSRSRAATPPRYLVTGRPVPPPSTDRAAARARFGLAGEDDRACSSSAARSARARSTRRRSRPSRTRPYRVLHVAGRARRRARCAAPGPHYDLRDYIDAVRRGARRRRPARRARGRLGLRDRRARAAGDARPVSARGRRPPDRQRALDGATRARRSCSPTPS